MNVTTKKSECDPKQQLRQLEVAIEHATAAARAIVADSDGNRMLIEVRYPSYQFRETLKAFRPNTAACPGRWVVLCDDDISTREASTAACRVLRHYYPDEDFAVASEVAEPVLKQVSGF